MDHIPHTNGQRIVRSFAGWILGLVVLFGVTELAAPPVSVAAPNTGTAQKTAKQCKTDRTTCEKACDQLIDVGDNIKRCKDRCTDDYLMCLPLRPSGQPGGKMGGTRPSILPGTNDPLIRRGIEGGQPGEHAPSEPEQTDQTGGTK
jgi:hypothetical protein